MKHYYLTFRSVTFAQRGEKVLTGQGIRCALLRTPRWMEEQGCGYALSVWARDIFPAMALLRENRLPVRRVYEQKEGGALEEREL